MRKAESSDASSINTARKRPPHDYLHTSPRPTQNLSTSFTSPAPSAYGEKTQKLKHRPSPNVTQGTDTAKSITASSPPSRHKNASPENPRGYADPAPKKQTRKRLKCPSTNGPR